MFGEPTTIPAVLAALSAQLISACTYDPSQVFLSLSDDDVLAKYPNKDLFIQIALRNGVPRAGDVYGGGNDLLTVDLTIAINLWLRLSTDMAFHDADQLTNATLGQLGKWLALMQAMQMYYPPGVSGAASIFVEPARNTRFDFKPRSMKTGHAKLASWWAIPAVLNLS